MASLLPRGGSGMGSDPPSIFSQPEAEADLLLTPLRARPGFSPTASSGEGPSLGVHLIPHPNPLRRPPKQKPGVQNSQTLGDSQNKRNATSESRPTSPPSPRWAAPAAGETARLATLVPISTSPFEGCLAIPKFQNTNACLPPLLQPLYS